MSASQESVMIQRIRRDMGIPQTEMARRMGMTRRAYQRMEGGTAKLIHLNAALWVRHRWRETYGTGGEST